MNAIKPIELPALVQENLSTALFVCNHSGGKDSQAMFNVLVSLGIPKENLVVVHSELPGMEWDGVLDHIKTTTAGYELIVTRASKTFLEMVERRGMFPSSSTRQCTSDLKRDPIAKVIRRIADERGFSLVFNCMGMRSQESQARANRPAFQLNKRISSATRTVYEWSPIKDYTLVHVLATEGHTFADLSRRRQAFDLGNQEEAFQGWSFHPVYVKGMTRLSCKLCIMAGKEDLRRSAQLDPAFLEHIVALEKRIGHTFTAPKKGQEARTLDQVLAA